MRGVFEKQCHLGAVTIKLASGEHLWSIRDWRDSKSRDLSKAVIAKGGREKGDVMPWPISCIVQNHGLVIIVLLLEHLIL